MKITQEVALKKIAKYARHLDSDSLSAAYDILAAVRKANAEMATAGVRSGSKVTFRGRRGEELRGTVLKVNRATMTVSVDGMTWKVGKSLIKKV